MTFIAAKVTDKPSGFQGRWNDGFSTPQNLADQPRVLPVHEGHLRPVALEDDLLVVEAEEVQERGVVVVVVHDVLHRVMAELVGLAVGEALLEAAAGHPHREAVICCSWGVL